MTGVDTCWDLKFANSGIFPNQLPLRKWLFPYYYNTHISVQALTFPSFKIQRLLKYEIEECDQEMYSACCPNTSQLLANGNDVTTVTKGDPEFAGKAHVLYADRSAYSYIAIDVVQ